jgi:hypothetical protein
MIITWAALPVGKINRPSDSGCEPLSEKAYGSVNSGPFAFVDLIRWCLQAPIVRSAFFPCSLHSIDLTMPYG